MIAAPAFHICSMKYATLHQILIHSLLYQYHLYLSIEGQTISYSHSK
nr:MAG TPA: hypothetical protein [Caudoviricetes sp.]